MVYKITTSGLFPFQQNCLTMDISKIHSSKVALWHIKIFSARSREERRIKMSAILNNISNIPINLSIKELQFVDEFMRNGQNATQAVISAGYKTRSPEKYGSTLLRKPGVQKEILRRIDVQESAKIADSNEILRFYTSVMRGEVLDQFGIEASLDTRIKAANELAKHKIELPLKLEQRNITNNIGSITLNFIPRQQELEVIS